MKEYGWETVSTGTHSVYYPKEEHLTRKHWEVIDVWEKSYERFTLGFYLEAGRPRPRKGFNRNLSRQELNIVLLNLLS